MKPSASTFALSATAVALAVLWVLSSRPIVPGGSSTPAESATADTPSSPQKTFSRGSESLRAPMPDPVWDWASIESEDYRKYVANLRAIGCPEQTIRDIILADLNKIYAPREAPFKDPLPSAAAPWDMAGAVSAKVDDAKSRKASYERRKKLREVELEKAGVVKELLGYTLPLPALRGWTTRSYDRFDSALSALPAEKRERAREVLEQFWEASDTLADQFGNKRTPEYFEQVKRTNEQRRESLLGVLSPDELEDFDMRTSNTAQRLSTQLLGLHISEDEFKAIYHARAELEEPFGVGIALNQIPGTDPNQLAAKETAAAELLKTTLGEDRFAQFQKSQDSNWQMLDKLKSRFELGDDSIEKAYELQKGLSTLGQSQLEVQQRIQDNQQLFNAALKSGNQDQIEALKNQQAADQELLVQSATKAEEQRRLILGEISAVLGEKAGKLFAARNNGTPVSAPRTVTTRTTRRTTEAPVFLSAPIVPTQP